jgi:anaerobic selenocysteine-containing dehydrogenase
MAEEIDTPGAGQIRALFTIAGNPVLSTPNGGRLARALASLELMVSVDVYLNETTRHAHVLLPGPSPLEVGHYDLAFSQLSIRNVARYSPPVLPMPAGMQPEWVTMLRLAGMVGGLGPGPDVEMLDEMVLRQLIERETGLAESLVHGRDPEELLDALGGRRGPERILDFMLRTGPYGEGFGAKPEGLRLEVLEAHPHGVDLGPLQPRIPEVLRTASGKIELAPEALVADVARLRGAMEERRSAMLLIGRRDLRSNNSWMHNVPQLMTGRPRCTLQVSPEDAGRLGLNHGGMARVRSNAGSIEVVVETTADIRPGVVSLPHGWGHDDAATRLREAQRHPGVNSNLLADECCLDELSGNAVLCGIPVEVYPAGHG